MAARQLDVDHKAHLNGVGNIRADGHWVTEVGIERVVGR